MTSKIFALLLFCLTTLFVTAQTPNVVLETERMMSFGSRPCFRMEFANATPRMVEDIWKDFAKKNFAAKVSKNKKSDELMAAGLRASFMGSDPFTLYAVIDKVGTNGTGISVWFDQGTAFLSRSNNSARTNEAVAMLKQFYLDVRRAVIGQEVKTEEDKLKDMDTKYKKLQRDNASMRKDIEEWKAKIKKAEDEILTNEKSQETTLADQETQRKAIEETKKRLQNVDTEIRQ